MSDEMNPKTGKVLTFVNERVNMKLVRIARGTWDVLAVLDDRGRCPVLDFIAALGANYMAAKRGLLRVLRVELPQDGPPPSRKRRGRRGTRSSWRES
jgi:hypothetical protein